MIFTTRSGVPAEDLLAFLAQLASESDTPSEPAKKATKETPSKTTKEATLTPSGKNRVIAHSPPTYREEDEDKILVSLDIPGFDESHLEIVLEDNVLTVSGQRTNKWRDTFVFRHHFPVNPEVVNSDPSTISADLTDGVLSVTLLKRKAPKPRAIRITTHKRSNNDNKNKTDVKQAPVATQVADKKPAPKTVTVEIETSDESSHETPEGVAKVSE
jgi:HSP20 family molecular chaperone IbpA